MEDSLSYYVSHVVKSRTGIVKRKDGSTSAMFSLQVITSSSEKKSVCWIDEDIRMYFNCIGEKSLKTVIADILSYYEKFDFEILTLDRLYDESLSLLIISNFFSGSENLQQKINEHKQSKGLE